MPGQRRAADLARVLDAFVQSQKPFMTTLLQAFFGVVSPGSVRRRLSDDVVRTALRLVDEQDARLDRRFRLLINWVGVSLALSLTLVTVVIIVALLRDRAELVKTIFEGIGLILSHGAVGAGGYWVGTSRRRPGRRR